MLDGITREWLDGTWEDGIPRVATGIKDRVNRLKGLGNAVVPQQIYLIYKAIVDLELKIKGEG
jgi:O-acetylhomoserine/O-acetylserine sulfhydrylase-like pyridoxal-dependent enzyme